MAGGGGSCLGEAAGDGLLETFDIVGWVLAELVGCRLAVKAVFPTGVVEYGRGDLFTVGGVDKQGADRVGPR